MDTADSTSHHQQQQHATQADLVRALESIDHTISFDFLPTTTTDTDTLGHEHEHVHEPTNIDDVATSVTGGIGSSSSTNTGELDDWSREQLQAEILKLRRLASTTTSATSAIDPKLQNVNNDTAALAEAIINASPPPPPTPTHQILGYPTETDSQGKKRTSRKRKLVSSTQSDGDGNVAEEPHSKSSQRHSARQRREDTGKRFEKERRSELSKLVRNKMRSALNLGEKDAIPHSYNILHNPLVDKVDGDGYGHEQSPAAPFVPDWYQALNDETNSAWLSKIVDEIIEDSSTGQYHKIPQEDFSPEIVNYTARTAFQNMCKKYTADNHPKGAERREKYTKKRRRWARKDLKQKKRAKSTLDASFEISLPPAALHLDYMSSEYSSAGEDDEDDDSALNVVRKEEWVDMISQTQGVDEQREVLGKGGWAVGLGEKVLEVRTPKWRSEQLNVIYRRLDTIAAEQADQRAHASSSAAVANSKNQSSPSPLTLTSSNKPTRAGHVAPSHRRFTLDPPLMRKGRQPRDLGEDWMWASGVKGVWPQLSHAITETETDGAQGIDLMHLENEHEHGLEVEVGVGVEQGWEEIGEAERLGLVSALEGLP